MPKSTPVTVVEDPLEIKPRHSPRSVPAVFNRIRKAKKSCKTFAPPNLESDDVSINITSEINHSLSSLSSPSDMEEVVTARTGSE